MTGSMSSFGIDNPELENPKTLAVSTSAHDGYSFQEPPDPASIGCSKSGDYQDLITWEQMSEKAHRALNAVDSGVAHAPFNDGAVEHKLARVWPFGSKNSTDERS
uniref:Uncharacterized protein n=1 Tax=Hyaloperonospora arabidopsidis (strain Emoy2) TaxID=559515 RepID=M4BXA3_HYAAE